MFDSELKRFHEKFEPMVEDYCAFKVYDDGKWYVIDADHPYPELYDDIPESVCRKAENAIGEAVMASLELRSDLVDPTPYYEAALMTVFDRVEFLGTDFVPGRIY